MRKCGSCGYLLLGDGDSCGRCGAALPAPDGARPVARAGASAESGVGDSRLSSPLPSLGRLSIPPPAPAAAATAAPAYGVGPTFAPTPERRTPGSGSGPPEPVAVTGGAPRTTRLGLIALAVVVAFAAGFGVMHLRSDPLPAGTSAFVDGKGVVYTSFDGSFQVRLPQAPTQNTSSMTINAMTATIFAATTQGDGYQIVAASIAFPDRLTSTQVQTALDDAFKEKVSVAGGGKVVRKDLTMRGKLPGVEGSFNVAGGRHAHMLIVASDSALVLIAVAAKSGTDRIYRALEASLIVR